MTVRKIFIALLLAGYTSAFGGSDRVLLNDLKVVTLHHGRMTTARRASPIPQMKCVGGTAACDSYVPQVIQCYNRGSDGFDVQWECKTDLDNDYRLGSVEVSCEGFDYPDDPYILTGSCGLEYTLDLTKEGYASKSHRDHIYHGNNHNSYSGHSTSHDKSGSMFGNLLSLVVVCVIIYAIYHTCLSGHGSPDRGTGPGYPGGPRGGGSGYHPGPPPPPGFRDDYMPGGGCSSAFGSQGSYAAPGNAGNTGGGFWTGMATGGLMGYMFGGRNNNYRAPGTGWGTGWGSGWGGGGGLGGLGGTSRRSTYSSVPSSSGTRTASGFGGTRRR